MKVADVYPRLTDTHYWFVGSKTLSNREGVITGSTPEQRRRTEDVAGGRRLWLGAGRLRD